jgi:hypothetical protein
VWANQAFQSKTYVMSERATKDNLLQRGIAALRGGDNLQARQLLGQAIRQDPGNEQAWLWLSGAMETTQDKLMCLNKVLAINPDHEGAQRGIAALQKNSAAYLPPAPPSPLETQPVPQPQHVKPSLVQAVLGTDLPAAEQIEKPRPIADSLDHSKALDQLEPEKQKALEGFIPLIAQDLTEGRKRPQEVINRISARGFSRKAVEQLVGEVAENVKRTRRQDQRFFGIPVWAWPFIVACGIMVIVPGGLLAGAFGGGGAAGCAAIARHSSTPTAIRVITCVGITIACWVAWAAISGILFTIF